MAHAGLIFGECGYCRTWGFVLGHDSSNERTAAADTVAALPIAGAGFAVSG